MVGCLVIERTTLPLPLYYDTVLQSGDETYRDNHTLSFVCIYF